MALNPENKIPSTADKNELFFDRNSNKIAYKDSLGITRIIEKEEGVQSVNDDGEDVVTVDNADAKNPIVGFAGVNVDGSTITGDGRKSNPLVAAYQAPAVDGITITGDGTLGNPLVAAGGGSSAVTYADVFFVDSTNPNYPGIQNRFDKPFATVNDALSAASALTPTQYNRVLIYVRKGSYSEYLVQLKNYVDIYCEPGVVFDSTSFYDAGATIDTRFMGKAVFYGYGNALGGIFYRVTGAGTNAYFEFDEAYVVTGFIEIGGSANLTVSARKIFSETLNKGFGITIRTSGNVTFNVSESISAWHDPISFTNFSGKFYLTCPRIYLHEGNTYGGNFKHVVIARNNLGGEAVINGDLIVNSVAGYYGGNSGALAQWTDGWMTIRINGNIYAENQFGIYGLGSSGAARLIVNGDVRTNHLVGYIASNCNMVFRNGTLMNWNNLVGVSEGYPVVSVGGSGSVWVENCHLHSLGLGATYPNIAAFWKDTTTATLNVYNSVHSGADASGFFIRNSAGGQPVNNVRILNCRATKPLDTNITDILTPTGFTQDANVKSINFI